MLLRRHKKKEVQIKDVNSGVDFDLLTKKEIISLAQEKNIELDMKMSKTEMIDTLIN